MSNRETLRALPIFTLSLLAILLGAKDVFASVDVGCNGGVIVSHATGKVVGYLCANAGCLAPCTKTGAPSSPPTPQTAGQFGCNCPGVSQTGCTRLVTWSVNNQGKITYTDAGCIGPCVAPAVCIEDLEPGQTSYVAWCHCY